MSDAILHAGIQGVQGGLDQFGRAAGQIASSNTSNSNHSTVDKLVEVKRAQITIEASAKVIAVAESTFASVIDKLA